VLQKLADVFVRKMTYFFPWYNDNHRHSGIGMMTPAMVHYGLASQVHQNRQSVLDAAYRLHPERFVRQRPSPHLLPKEVWINKPLNSEENSLNNSLECLKLVDTHRFAGIPISGYSDVAESFDPPQSAMSPELGAYAATGQILAP
jgi:hypothetical protein